MADNTTLNTGTGGDVIASDDIAGVKFQRVKLVHGADGVNDGDVADGNPLPVDDAGGSLTVDDGGASLTVDNAALSVTGGGVEATALRVTIASDSTGVVSVDDNGGSLTVDGSVTIGAGTANIGDVDVLTVPAPLSTTGGGTEATALRVTVASDSTGVLSIDDNGGSLTVDGTVAVSGTTTTQDTASLVDNAAFTDGTSRVLPAGFIFDDTAGTALTENDVGAARMSSTRALVVNLEDATTRGQRQAVNSNGGAAVCGCVAHDAVDSGNPVKIGAKAIAHGANPTAVAAADRTDLYANRAGVLFTIGGHPNTITRSVRIADADGAQTDASIAGTINAGTKVVVTALTVTCDAGNTGPVACKIGFGASTIPADSTSGANGVLLDHEGIAAGSGVVIGNGGGILGVGADGEELRLTCEDPAGGFICVTFSYFTIES